MLIMCDRGVLVSVHETVTSIAVSILTSQYTMNLLSLFQNYVLIPSFENAGEDPWTMSLLHEWQHLQVEYRFHQRTIEKTSRAGHLLCPFVDSPQLRSQ